MATLLEMTAEIVKAHASASKMTSEEILRDLKMVYTALQRLGAAQSVGFEERAHAALTVKQAFKKDEVICMVCGQAGMKTLTRHLKSSHDLEPSAYRQQFGIPYNQSLSSRDFTEFRRAMALERGLADYLAKARQVKAANMQARNASSAAAG